MRDLAWVLERRAKDQRARADVTNPICMPDPKWNYNFPFRTEGGRFVIFWLAA